MTASLSRPRTLGPLGLPPMPRRRSCDRCHEQKVRCVTEVKDGTVTLGGIVEESESSLAGHVVSSVPCARCRKTGDVCIYSPQRRPGRPRLQRDSSTWTQLPRKRVKRVSRDSRSSSSSPPSTGFFQSTSSPASSRLSTAVATSLGGVGFGVMAHSTEYVHEQAAIGMLPLLPPSATVPSCCEPGSLCGARRQTPPVPSQWQATSYVSDGDLFLGGICDPQASVVEDAAAPSDPVPGVSSTAENIMGDYPLDLPTRTHPDHFLEKVAHINLRIHLAGRALPSLPRTLASLSSPPVRDILDASCTLINVVDSFALGTPTLVPQPSDDGRRQTANLGPPTSPTLLLLPAAVIDTALDSSLCLMLHACHQALLGVFEALSVLLLLCLAESQQFMPPRMPQDESFSFISLLHNQQPAAMTNLINHLLNELDRAFLPLAIDSEPPHFWEHKVMPALTKKVGRYYKAADLRPRTRATWQGASNHSLLSELEQGQIRVRNQVKDIGQLLG